MEHVDYVDAPFLRMSLDEWREFIEKLIEQYGELAILEFDAGYNNVTLEILRPAVRSLSDKKCV